MQNVLTLPEEFSARKRMVQPVYLTVNAQESYTHEKDQAIVRGWLWSGTPRPPAVLSPIEPPSHQNPNPVKSLSTVFNYVSRCIGKGHSWDESPIFGLFNHVLNGASPCKIYISILRWALTQRQLVASRFSPLPATWIHRYPSQVPVFITSAEAVTPCTLPLPPTLLKHWR
jgi:hypothetical protein